VRLSPVKPLRRILAGCILLSLVSVCAARDVAVVVDKGSATSALSSPDLVKIFKGTTAKWPNGKRITVVLSKIDSQDMRLVLQRVYRLTADQVRDLANSQKASIVIVDSDDLVLGAVHADPGAIGVVNLYSINSSVKVLKIDDKLPLEEGYLLHANY
jgi:ABC-type phosphate transport system substrate-binding protein